MATLPIGPVTMDGPLPDMRCLSMHASEGLGRCFSYQIDVSIQPGTVTATDLLGKSLTVHWTSLDPATQAPRVRHFNGIVSALEYQGFDANQRSLFRLVARPWFWFLNRRVNCRIFPNSNVIDILKVFFDGKPDYLGFAVWNQDGLKGDHTLKREFVVQYRESDFNFLQRLMESEGISYFFLQEDKKHTMMLCDTFVKDPKKAPEVPFRIPDSHLEATLEYVSQWNVLNEVQPGMYTHWDFDFQNPAIPLTSSTTISRKYNLDSLEVYDYPGDFPPKVPAADGLDEGDPSPFGAKYSALRLEQMQLPFAAAHAASNAFVIAVGKTFSLVDHLREDLNQEYLVVAADYILSPPSEVSGSASAAPVFFCSLVAMDLKTPFRPPLTVAKPVVRGPQTATVTTKGKDEITSDPYGRVYVKFHWDRDTTRADFTSSCPVRVSQVWAGTGFGAVFTPRVGQEVIVDFLEGDPDKPIIVGRVHNKLNMPPYDPAQQPTRSGIRSRSSPDGTQVNFNEIRFEDKKGHEELHFQAERNQTTLVKASQSITVGGDRAVTVAGNETYTVKKKRVTDVTLTDTTTVHDDTTHDYKTNQTITVGNNYSLTTTDGMILLKHKDAAIDISAGEDVHAGNKNAGMKMSSAGDITISNGHADMVMTIGGEITISNGDAAVIMKKGGDLTIVNSAGNIIVHQGSNMVTVTKSSVEISATTVNIAAGASSIALSSSQAAVTSPMIKLNS